MRLLVDATEAPRFEGRLEAAVSLGVAACFVVLAVGQLFTFEKFADVIKLWLLPGGMPVTQLFAALIPTLEIFALPFLLSMRLSPLMRWFSLGCGIVVSLGWLAITACLAARPLANVGLFGATVPLSAGLLPGSIALIIAAGMAYVTVKYFKARRV